MEKQQIVCVYINKHRSTEINIVSINTHTHIQPIDKCRPRKDSMYI